MPVRGARDTAGAGRIRGRVIHVGEPYMARPEFSWDKLPLKIVLGLLIVAVALPIAFFVLCLSIALAILRLGGMGLFRGFWELVVNLIMWRAIGSRGKEEPVRSVRIKDDSGREYMVHVRGDIESGGFNVNDEVEIEGRNRGGTIIFRRGFNLRVGSEIKVRRR